jgi:hypothetical protein
MVLLHHLMHMFVIFVGILVLFILLGFKKFDTKVQLELELSILESSDDNADPPTFLADVLVH